VVLVGGAGYESILILFEGLCSWDLHVDSFPGTIGRGILAVEQKVSVEANVSIENDTLKVDPKVLKVGFLTLPEDSWISPIKSAMEEVEVSANEAYQDVLAKG
jgi:hypothetical protein